MSTRPATTSTPIEIVLNVKSQAKPDMNADELFDHVKKGKELKAAAEKFGDVTGHIVIGKQKFKLGE